MKCFYHSADLDGKCSGALIKLQHPACEMIGINYGYDFPWDTIGPEETVYMVDFSLQPFSKMERLHSILGPKLVWIDHHKSAIDDLDQSGRFILGIQKVGLGACALVWEYLNKLAMPDWLMLLARYDVWDHDDPRTLPFQYGMRNRDNGPDAPIWRTLTNTGESLVESIIHEGEVILNWEIRQNKIRAKSLCFETELDGLKVLAANQGLINSQLFDSLWDPAKYDAMLTFNWRNGQWTISLYSTKDTIDVGSIAKCHGGGGHKGAAGFQCRDLPFALPRK